MEVGEAGTHGGEARAVGDPSQRGSGGGKRDTGAGPSEQAHSFQAVQGGPEVLSPDASDERVELRERIVRDLVGRELAAARDHFLAGEPDAQIPELDVPLPIDPPQEAEDLDGQQHKAPMRLPRRAWSVDDCGRWHSSVSLDRADSP